MKASITILPGDGIGPEVTAAAQQILTVTARLYEHEFIFERGLIGGCAIDAHGSALSDETLIGCLKSQAVLLGAVGGPKWDNPLASVRPEQGLLRLRKEMGVYANLRPLKLHPALIDASPLKPDRLEGVDMIIVRELTGGLYFGEPKKRWEADGKRFGVDTMIYDEEEVRRVVDLAFQLALSRRKKLTSVDKANVLESSRLWRQVVIETKTQFPKVEVEHMLVDTASMRLVTSPGIFDVLVTENTFGDILSDEASVLAGSMGMLPSASLGDSGPGLYEPIHGSAPDIAGRGIANPIGAILSAAMLLRYSLQLKKEAELIELAVDRVLSAGCRTVDLGGKLSTQEMTKIVENSLLEAFDEVRAVVPNKKGEGR